MSDSDCKRPSAARPEITMLLGKYASNSVTLHFMSQNSN